MLPEARYTPANDFCGHPEYWHSPDSEATETEVSQFIGALVRLVQPEFVLETGTYHGHTTFEIGISLFQNGHGKCVSLENDALENNRAHEYFDERLAYIYYKNSLGREQLPVTLLLQNTMEYVPDKDIDLAFFDSWQEGRHEEFHRYHDMGRLKPGAIVAFHDTAPHHQVLKHITKLEADGYIKALYFHTPRGLTVAQVV